MAETVAVIIPTYNRAALVTEAIHSALTQTRVPDQIVVIDDGSTDGTWRQLQQFRKSVTLIHHATNLGRAAARNTGIDHTDASLLCFLDSDDLLTEHSIELRATWLEDCSASQMVFGAIRQETMDGVGLSVQITRDLSFPEIVKYNSVPIHAYMFRRSLLPKPPYFDPELAIGEDWLFLARLLSQKPQIHVIDQVVGLYRQHEGMTLPSDGISTSEMMTVQDRIVHLAAFSALSPTQRARAHTSQAIDRMSSGFGRAARASLLRCASAAPWYLPAYFVWLAGWIAPKAPQRLIRSLKPVKAKRGRH